MAKTTIQDMSKRSRAMLTDAIKDRTDIGYGDITRLISVGLFDKTPTEFRESRPTDTGSIASSARTVMTNSELAFVCAAETAVAVMLVHKGDIVDNVESFVQDIVERVRSFHLD